MALLLPLSAGFYVFAGTLVLVLAAGIAATVRSRTVLGITPQARVLRSAYASLLLGSTRSFVAAIASFVFHLGLVVIAVLHLTMLGYLGARLYVLDAGAFQAIIYWLRAVAKTVALSGTILLLLHVEQMLRGFRPALGSITGTLILTTAALAIATGYASLNTHIALGLLGAAYAAYTVLSSHITRGSKLLAQRILRT
ncbi:hypothetical protein [Hyperthermus butylicus]|uniref:Uncharacterized protein n=1 Tax=Hyperthermus butylicus (strain DSM 5456 / JCM 9403 / PLM1-5) TaxID=415426 RepID=A2BLJ2_HYPBU|nr:hypothetical protein [Hyperthermus butylicus]ABM80853.1 hypothetical protein Hbut_1006 [Hyperthermus butylicus DSM 5456]